MANTADQQTQLTGTVANPQLRVENSSTASGARGIIGRITAAAAGGNTSGILGGTASTNANSFGVIAQNTGGGSGLSAVSNAGVPSIKVSNNAKIDLLNADLVDGFDAVAAVSNGTVLLKGKLTSGREQFIAPDAGTRPIVKLDNIVQVNAIRDNLNDFVCELSLKNLDAAKTYAFFRQVFQSGAAAVASDNTLAPGATDVSPSTATGEHVRWQLWVTGPNDASARVITVESGIRKPSGTECDYFATVFVGGD